MMKRCCSLILKSYHTSIRTGNGDSQRRKKTPGDTGRAVIITENRSAAPFLRTSVHQMNDSRHPL